MLSRRRRVLPGQEKTISCYNSLCRPLRAALNPSRDRLVADDNEWEDLARSGLLDDDDQPGIALMGDEEICAED